MICALLRASTTPRTLTSAVSFWSPMKSFSRGGTTRRTACGITTKRSDWKRVSPSERAAASWLGCTDSMPARYTSDTYAEYTRTSATVAQKISDSGSTPRWSAGMPDAEHAGSTRIVGTPRKTSAYTIASARIGKNTGPGRLRSTAIPSAATRMIASAIRKILTLILNASDDLGERLAVDLPVEEVLT